MTGWTVNSIAKAVKGSIPFLPKIKDYLFKPVAIIQFVACASLIWPSTSLPVPTPSLSLTETGVRQGLARETNSKKAEEHAKHALSNFNLLACGLVYFAHLTAGCFADSYSAIRLLSKLSFFIAVFITIRKILCYIELIYII